ncbi:hypothetical protein MC118_005473 [Salmonella enterica]|nr:hypothetical protein [Salmonella enterica]
MSKKKELEAAEFFALRVGEAYMYHAFRCIVARCTGMTLVTLKSTVTLLAGFWITS